MQSFLNKTAVITGAGSGMGRYLAVLLAKAGCNVAICDIDENALAETSKMVNHYNVACSTHTVDIADKEQIDNFYEKVLERHKTVDLLFNNAGITVLSDFANMSEKDWDRVIETNLTGTFNLSKIFIKNMIKNKSGRIINISSISGLMGNPGQVNYASSKAALSGFTKSLAKEVGSSIKLMKGIKHAFDPKGLLNPGKLFV